MGGTWELLTPTGAGTHKLTTAGDVLDTGTIAVKDHLRVSIHTIHDGGAIKENIVFNSTTNGNPYSRRRSNDGATDSPEGGQPQLEVRGDEENDRYLVMTISNVLNKEKLVIGEYVINEDGAANAPSRSEWVGKWANNAQIEKITVTNTGAGNYGVGSFITVWGRSDDVVSDEKATLADATSDATKVASTSDITDLTWTTVGSSTGDTFYILKDTSNDLIDIKNAGNSGAYGSASIGYATLSEALGTAYWRIRYKLKFITITNESTGGKSFHTNFFIVDDPANAESGSNSANGFGVKFIADSGGGGAKRTYYYSVTNGTYSSSTDMNYAPSNGAEMYFEYVYSDGTCTLNLYDDDTYEDRLGSSTQNATKTGTFSGLKYPQIVLRQDTGGNGVMEIDMSALEIINRQDEKDSLTNVPANTRYEETDTRKIYRRVAGGTVSQTTQTGNGELFNDVEIVAQKFTSGSSKIGLTVDSVDVYIKNDTGSVSTSTNIECKIGQEWSSGVSYGTKSPSELSTSYSWQNFTPASAKRTIVENDRIMIRWADGAVSNDSIRWGSDANATNQIANETGQYSSDDGSSWATRSFDYCYKINYPAEWKERGTA